MNTDELIAKFETYADYFNCYEPPFSGPSTYFHRKAIETRRKYSSISEAFNDDQLFEYVYATLTAWGMHRMGDTKTKLTDFKIFKDSFIQQRDQICEAGSLEISEIPEEKIGNVAQCVWNIIDRLKVGVGKTKIIAGSKALHHLLPDLVPPIDHQYTLMFFTGRKTFRPADESGLLNDLLPKFRKIAICCKDEIRARLKGGIVEPQMNTSTTKIIDNAIVGYVLENPKEE